MKTQLITSILFLLALNVTLQAQTILFQENFETTPITSIVNSSTDSVPNGTSPCGQASRGTTVDFNSTNVDFQNTQNSSFFLGVNPESPCGGFYTANLISDTMNWNCYDSLIFKCRYFKGTTLGWGPATLEVAFESSGSTLETIFSEFSTTDNWDSLEVTLSSVTINPSMQIVISMGGGEGVGIDDIEILGYKTITTTNISPVACDSYTSPSGDYTWTSSGTYNDTISDAFGCDSVIITINLTINTVDTSVTQNGAMLTANSSEATYQWLDCDNSFSIITGETNQSFTATVNGNYAVEITDNGCVDTSACYNITSVGVNENFSDINVSIYPNPTSGVITIEGDNIIEMELMNINGQTISKIAVKEKQLDIDLSKQAKGSYLIKIITDKGVGVEKIVLE